MPSDDLKIQLESVLDMSWLKSETFAFVQRDFPHSHQAQIISFVDELFADVAHNVQVQGVDYSDITNDPYAIEPLDEALIKRLEEVQAEAEQLMMKVIKKRKSVPIQFAEKYTTRIIETVKCNLREDVPMELTHMNSDNILPIVTSKDLLNPVDALKELSQTIPGLCAKLERAKHVLTEESKNGCAAEPNEISMENNSTIDKNILKHRRASQHFDVASRLSFGCIQEKDLI